MGAVTGISAGTYSWLSTATEIATFGAAIVSIVVGCGSAWYLYEKAKTMRQERKSDETMGD